jgi:hypothetical protein
MLMVTTGTRADPERHCRGAIGTGGAVQALWLFSSDACGVYGYQDIRIEHAGRTDPRGTILFVGDNGKLNINSQSGLLLKVLKPQVPSPDDAGAMALAKDSPRKLAVERHFQQYIF